MNRFVLTAVVLITIALLIYFFWNRDTPDITPPFVFNEEEAYIEDEFYFRLTEDYDGFFITDTTSEVDENILVETGGILPQIVRDTSVEIRRTFYFAKSKELLRTFRVKVPREQRDEFIQQFNEDITNIDYAEKIPKFTVNNAPIDPQDAEYQSNGQWYLAAIKAPAAWGETTGSSAVAVAVIDNGFYRKHNELVAKWDTTRARDVADEDANPFNANPDFWHGTHVAGIVGAETDNNGGIASIGWNVKVVPIKAATGNTQADYITHGYEGIAWAVQNGIKIINASWGITLPFYEYTPDEENTIDTSMVTLNQVMQFADEQGSLVIAAAGNENNEDKFVPAAHPSVFAVTATDRDQDRLDDSGYGDWVDIAAPGWRILSTAPNNGFMLASGTSMAAPLVAGTAALMLSNNPNINKDQIKDCITKNADPIGLPYSIRQLDAEEAVLCSN